MKVGYYVRTDDGLIGKVISEPYEYKDSVGCDIDFGNNDVYNEYEMYQSIIKSSSNIIDLLKKKDIVIDYKGNMYQVVKVWKDYVFTDKKNKYGQVITLVDYQIKSIVTKEQFESMEYKVGE